MEIRYKIRRGKKIRIKKRISRKEYLKRRRIYNKRYFDTHKEKCRAMHRNWVELHLERARKSQSQLRKDHPNKRNKYRKRNYRKNRETILNKRNSRQGWTEQHIDLIFERNLTDSELGKIIGRSVQAIQAKRFKVGMSIIATFIYFLLVPL